ncbi:hypothetical protein G4B88_011641, partial [Cannabis sativa]
SPITKTSTAQTSSPSQAATPSELPTADPSTTVSNPKISEHLTYSTHEQSTYADIEAAYRCLVEKYGVKEEDVILYGQSVGSGPTLPGCQV